MTDPALNHRLAQGPFCGVVGELDATGLQESPQPTRPKAFARRAVSPVPLPATTLSQNAKCNTAKGDPQLLVESLAVTFGKTLSPRADSKSGTGWLAWAASMS